MDDSCLKRGYFFPPIIKGHLDNQLRGHCRPPKSGMMKLILPLQLQNPPVTSKAHIVAGQYSSPSLSIIIPPHAKAIRPFTHTNIHTYTESLLTLNLYFAKFCFLSDKNKKNLKKINHLNL